MDERVSRATILSDRRRIVKAFSSAAGGLVFFNTPVRGEVAEDPNAKIRDLQLSEGVKIIADDGNTGTFEGSRSQNLDVLKSHGQRVHELLVGRNPLDRTLSGEMLWEAMYPGKARLYAEGRDPRNGYPILNRPRRGRHTDTGRVFMAISTVDIALWDLRGRLLKRPDYWIMGEAHRTVVPVYWRPGEANKGLGDARRRSREAYDRACVYKKWHFTKSAKHRDSGLKENNALVRVLREELPDAHLMFDNHSIRYFGDVDDSITLCKGFPSIIPSGFKSRSVRSIWKCILGSGENQG